MVLPVPVVGSRKGKKSKIPTDFESKTKRRIYCAIALRWREWQFVALILAQTPFISDKEKGNQRQSFVQETKPTSCLSTINCIRYRINVFKFGPSTACRTYLHEADVTS